MTNNNLEKEEIKNILGKCYSIEKTTEKIYSWLEGHHKNTPLEKIWQKTASEEDNHALQFKLAINNIDNIMDNMLISSSTVEKSLNEVEMIFEEIVKEKPGMEEALKIAINMEEKYAALHMQHISIFKDASLKNLFKAMMAADQEHVKTLKKALKELEK